LIIIYLNSNHAGVPFKDEQLRAELLELAKEHAPPKTYVIDRMVHEAGRGLTLLRLPPYHPDLNPIEFIWGNMKVIVFN
jgi:transposase